MLEDREGRMRERWDERKGDREERGGEEEEEKEARPQMCSAEPAQ